MCLKRVYYVHGRRWRCGSGGKSCRLAVGGLPVRSHPGRVEVSLSETPIPQLLLVGTLRGSQSPLVCVCVWMRGINCTALWIKALYKCSPFALTWCGDHTVSSLGEGDLNEVTRNRQCLLLVPVWNVNGTGGPCRRIALWPERFVLPRADAKFLRRRLPSTQKQP